MSTHNVDPEELAEHLFIEWGFEVTKIPEGREQRPDFLVTRNEEATAIELKTKYPQDTELKARYQAFDAGKVHSTSTQTTKHKKHAKTIYDGKNQLSYDLGEQEFKVLCFLALGFNSEAQIMQIEGNLYGKTHVADWSDETAGLFECYYFGFNDFFKYQKHLDGAILIWEMPGSVDLHGKICINNHSPNYQRFRQSELVSTFGTAKVDPPELDREGKAYVVDSDVDRRSNEAVLNYLKEKYSLGDLTRDISMNMLTAEVVIPKS